MSRICDRAALFTLVICGCTVQESKRASDPTLDQAPPVELSVPRVGNDDPMGVDEQPDWNASAELMRELMAPRLESDKREAEHAACVAMVDAAKVPPSLRASELRGCERETSAAAAKCVELQIAEEGMEFAWLVDQCSRAFPRAEPEAPTGTLKRAASFEIAFTGDVIFGRYRADGFDPIPEPGLDPFAEVKALLEADLTVVNLETPVLEQIPERSPIGAQYRFAASREHVRLLAGAGVDVASLANNHSFDLRRPGQEASPRILAEEGIMPIGASRELGEELFRVESIERKGWRIGFVAATARRNAPEREGALRLPFVNTQLLEKQLGPVLRAARAGHDVLVVYVHWGDEYAEIPDAGQRRAARDLLQHGADLVIGHHPHVLQGVEVFGSGVAAYSLGNFLFENTHELPRQTGILRVRFTNRPACLEWVRFHPAYITRTPFKHPVPARAGMGKRVRARVIDQGKGLGARWSQIAGSEDLLLERDSTCASD